MPSAESTSLPTVIQTPYIGQLDGTNSVHIPTPTPATDRTGPSVQSWLGVSDDVALHGHESDGEHLHKSYVVCIHRCQPTGTGGQLYVWQCPDDCIYPHDVGDDARARLRAPIQSLSGWIASTTRPTVFARQTQTALPLRAADYQKGCFLDWLGRQDHSMELV